MGSMANTSCHYKKGPQRQACLNFVQQILSAVATQYRATVSSGRTGCIASGYPGKGGVVAMAVFYKGVTSASAARAHIPAAYYGFHFVY
jgi:hypothetical protein